jgi:hypothetical protein
LHAISDALAGVRPGECSSSSHHSAVEIGNLKSVGLHEMLSVSLDDETINSGGFSNCDHKIDDYIDPFPIVFGYLQASTKRFVIIDDLAIARSGRWFR